MHPQSIYEYMINDLYVGCKFVNGSQIIIGYLGSRLPVIGWFGQS